jgi:UDP-N-acetylmuramate dehydrogenase
MAKRFAGFSNADELSQLLIPDSPLRTLILGGGSNILFTKDYAGLVLKNEIKGIELVHEDADYVFVKTGAGESWHQLVLHCISRGWAGVENLSLIPGSVGAAPIQNIGAYGVELDDVFWSLEAFHLRDRKMYTLTKSDCEFGYRDSVFKNRLKNELAIIAVTLQLKKKPVFHTSYGAILQELENMGVKELSIKAISQAVINIRTSKLADPKLMGNAGSFFKNPTVSNHEHDRLKSLNPDMPVYPQPDGTYKLAAGWLIEQCGWKGYRRGDAGCHAMQALVLINYGKATGMDIYNLSEEIVISVKEKFRIVLEREVNVI